MTNKHDLNQQRLQEKRASRRKQTKQLIRSNSWSTVMNNHKWLLVFELVQHYDLPFELKVLLDTNIIKVDQILELEKNCILVTDYDAFIDFLEIEELRLEKRAEFLADLEKNKIDFVEERNELRILGYRSSI